MSDPSRSALPRQTVRTEPVVEPEEFVRPIGAGPSAGRVVELGPADSIGQALREARLEAGLTTYELAQTTHIRAARLIEIESDDYAGCGSSALARGRLAAIARAVGVDPGPLLAAFDAQQSEAPASAKVLPDLPQFREARLNATTVLFWLLCVVALYPIALLVAHVLG
ncbi:MAG: helix-turn-helix domain-containing protein [Sporichthyaceae bacterium]